jgi:hypothetical protein
LSGVRATDHGVHVVDEHRLAVVGLGLLVREVADAQRRILEFGPRGHHAGFGVSLGGLGVRDSLT